jgi:hypothetical protein
MLRQEEKGGIGDKRSYGFSGMLLKMAIQYKTVEFNAGKLPFFAFFHNL